MKLEDLINLKWLGFKKGRNTKGAIYGYFIPKGKVLIPADSDLGPVHFDEFNNFTDTCIIFWGKIGKTINFEEVRYNEAFQSKIFSRMKNYQTMESLKLLNCASFMKELEMFMSIQKLKGKI